MKKQDAPKASAQQLSLDLKATKGASSSQVQASRITRFVDAGTLNIRQQAIRRVTASGIFPPPKAKSR